MSDDAEAPALDRVYDVRFGERDRAAKSAIWVEITRWLQRYVDAGRPVLDVACDTGDFIANVRAAERWATDIRDVSAALPAEVRFVQASGLDLAGVLPTAYFGTLFMSNYLEHLPDRASVLEQFRVARELLSPGGRLVVLQPNIRFTGGAYWDFIDHHTALTDRSLEEAGEIAGLRAVDVIPRFLPYTTKGRLPADPRLVRLYLRVRAAWRLLGKQTLYVAERPA